MQSIKYKIWKKFDPVHSENPEDNILNPLLNPWNRYARFTFDCILGICEMFAVNHFDFDFYFADIVSGHIREMRGD